MNPIAALTQGASLRVYLKGHKARTMCAGCAAMYLSQGWKAIDTIHYDWEVCASCGAVEQKSDYPSAYILQSQGA